ncbi:unnamed protein product, partial [marine sediment metagenome]
PRTITYVEAHGPGTALGDPIEIQGLQDAFEPQTKDKQYCAIGAVKSNIGHCEGAAGIAEIVKVILQLQGKMLVPTLTHSENLNPNIIFEETPFFVQQELSEWDQYEDYPRRAGVNSFGVGGVNAHAILEEYNPSFNRVAAVGAHIIPISAKKIESLKMAVSNLHAFLKERLTSKDVLFSDVSLPDVAYTLQVGRVPMRHRLALIVEDIPTLVEKLESLINDQELFDKETMDIKAGSSPQINMDPLVENKDL